MTFENLSGRQLGQYELRRLLGTGGMAAVYLGYQINLKREVAVKVLSHQLAEQPDYYRRFTREAETAAGLEHAHIVPIYDYGTHAGTAYVVMRLLTGGTLSDRINRHVQRGHDLPSLGETSRVLDQLSRALDYAHQRGIIHRDIKPSNVMFDDQGTAFVVDFGIAKLLYSTSSVTGTGMTLGTPMYMAPEQWRAEDLSPAADLYALGVMTYALVTGQVPFEAPTPYALMHKHLNEAPTPPNMLRPDVPKAVAEAIEQALAKDPADRFPDVITFAEAFARAIRGNTGEMTGFFTTPITPATMLSAADLAQHATEADSVPAGTLGPRMPGDLPPTPQGQESRSGAAAAELADVALHAERSTIARIRATLRRQPVVGMGTMVVVIGLVLIGGVLFMGGSGGGDGADSGAANQVALAGTATQSPAMVQILPSNTPADAGQTQVAVVNAPTDTPSATATFTVTATTTDLPTLMPTSTQIPTATPTATHTPDLDATANAMVNERFTQTAASWTDTPTPDIGQTAQAIARAALTGTAASWTDTPIPTVTPTTTPIPIPSATPMPTATPTDLPTRTPVPTQTPTRTPRPTATPLIPADCDGFLPPRLVGEGQACVSDAEANNIRTYPESNDVVGQIPPGGVFTILEGPECTRGTMTVWYYVAYNGIEGWTAEGSLRTGTYWLAPLPCPRSESSSSGGYADLVPDYDGVIMEVTEEGDSLNVRNVAGLGGTKIDELYWGDRALWAGETTQVDGYTWYAIKLYSGRTAYIAYDTDWIVPRDPAKITPNIAIDTTIRITSDGNDTHLRSNPSVINSTEVQTLYTGDALTVIDGPTYAEYFLWWNLRLPDGRTGWAVDVPGWWQVQ